MDVRSHLATRLRRWADLLDRNKASTQLPWSFTFEPGVGAVFRTDGRGARLYCRIGEYEKSHTEAGWGVYRFYMQSRSDLPLGDPNAQIP